MEKPHFPLHIIQFKVSSLYKKKKYNFVLLEQYFECKTIAIWKVYCIRTFIIYF